MLRCVRVALCIGEQVNLSFLSVCLHSVNSENFVGSVDSICHGMQEILKACEFFFIIFKTGMYQISI
jgi:hypothetical protein